MNGTTVNGTEARLASIRGRALAKSHNARTIAALASNPGCARRAIMDAAGADKPRIAAYAGFPAPFGQSRFALARGNAFEAQVKADGAAQLLTLLREHLDLPIPQAHYDDLGEVGGNTSLDLRHARTKTLLARAAAAETAEGTMFDHPLLRLQVGGRYAFLEPDLIAFQLHGRFRVLEIKSFAVIDGQADGDKVAAAAIQSAVYVLALRDALAEFLFRTGRGGRPGHREPDRGGNGAPRSGPGDPRDPGGGRHARHHGRHRQPAAGPRAARRAPLHRARPPGRPGQVPRRMEGQPGSPGPPAAMEGAYPMRRSRRIRQFRTPLRRNRVRLARGLPAGRGSSPSRVPT